MVEKLSKNIRNLFFIFLFFLEKCVGTKQDYDNSRSIDALQETLDQQIFLPKKCIQTKKSHRCKFNNFLPA